MPISSVALRLSVIPQIVKLLRHFVGKFLGLTEGTPLQRKLSALAYLLFGCAILLAIVVFGVNRFNVTVSIVHQGTRTSELTISRMKLLCMRFPQASQSSRNR